MNGMKKKNNLKELKWTNARLNILVIYTGLRTTMSMSGFEKNAINDSVEEKLMKRKL